MNIRESEDNLFTEWKTKRPGFVSDGVAEEEEYLNNKIKLLFVLKEVNDLNGGNWDLREFVRGGGRIQTWSNIARWVEGIRRISDEISWEELANNDELRRKQMLRSIAAINLKKSPGGHTTDPAELSKIAEEDKIFLNRQFALYHPDIVICCGSITSYTFNWLIDICKKPKWKTTSRGVSYHEYESGKYVIEYSHPEARCASYLLYYGLIDAIREILMKKIN